MKPLVQEIVEAIKRGVEKGGEGSGSFGHAGRPGKVGGQAPHSSGGSGSTADSKPVSHDKSDEEAVKVLGNFTFDKENDRFTWHGTVEGLDDIRDKAVKMGFELVNKVKEKLAEREAYKLTEEYQLKKKQQRRTLILIGTYLTGGPVGAAVVYYMMKDRDAEKEKE